MLVSGEPVLVTDSPYQVFSIEVQPGQTVVNIGADLMESDGTLTVTTSDGVDHRVDSTPHGLQGDIDAPVGTTFITFRGGPTPGSWTGKGLQVIVV